jgi:hypothetical protein
MCEDCAYADSKSYEYTCKINGNSTMRDYKYTEEYNNPTVGISQLIIAVIATVDSVLTTIQYFKIRIKIHYLIFLLFLVTAIVSYPLIQILF